MSQKNNYSEVTINRRQLDPQLEDLKSGLVKVFDALKAQTAGTDWYPHVSAEKRNSQGFTVHPKAQHSTSDSTVGIMLRIFAGNTIFERATNTLALDELMQLAKDLVAEVVNSGAPKLGGGYRPATWTERVRPGLESEILDQIPSNPSPDQWVHFGVRQRMPLWSDASGAMAYARKAFEELKAYGDQLPPTELCRRPDVVSVRMGLSDNHFLFIDQEVRLSQALQRNSIHLTVIMGGDRGQAVRGGLGGQETVEVYSQDYALAYGELAKSLRADRLTPGKYKVLMSPSITGVFAHEAFGHSQEGDTWARGRSQAQELYRDKIRVGNELATIVNNPAIYQNGEENFASWGSYFFDEEGWFAERQELVSEGWLNPPMTNLSSATRLNVPRTANGKRERWSHGMYVRQTNTYFSQGDKTFSELIKMVDYGFYAGVCFGGMEDPKGMGIQVGVGYLEEIKDGKFTGRTFKAPNGGAIQMTGYVPDYLKTIIAKSKIEAFSAEADKAPHPWNEVGGCGKYHKEYVVAGCGGPFMLIDQVHLG